jgi:nitroreductase
MYVQTVMLLARSYGLDTCSIEAWTFWHKTASAFLALAPEEMVFCGMALGHGDPAAPINQWRSPREDVDRFTAFSGFADQATPQC